MISKEVFVESIEAIRLLTLSKDKNNYITIRVFIKLLEIFFPKDENGFSEIEHFIIFLNFGKPSMDSEYESPGAFYDRLIKLNKI